ncbi:hypothetical protein AGDE_16101 [Angomonas deanei]|nr:hypothetical protein AGDE_16101 [Angomonas deanei]|eukprot:EPY17723.1 hypothetical protein AGDE_16101 [Angomonas deanei]
MDLEDTAVVEATKYAELTRQLEADEEEEELGALSGEDATATGAEEKAVPAPRSANRVISSKEQLELLPPGQRTVHEGHCATFRPQKRFGFVAPDVGGPDIYFTQNSLMLGFTKLALTAYYKKHGLELPPALQETDNLDNEEDGEGEAPQEGQEEDGLSPADMLSKLDSQKGELRRCAPEPTEPELEMAARAAEELDERGAQLLLWGVTHGKPTVHVRDRLSFTVHRNRLGKSNSRLLRAEHIRGGAQYLYALPMEQAWFHKLFRPLYEDQPNAAVVGFKSELPLGNATRAEAAEVPPGEESTAPSPPLLVRYRGMIRTYDPNEKRGYIQCEEPNAPDVLFQESSVLWDTARVPPEQRLLKERVKVSYSVAGKDNKLTKYVASLITNEDDTLLSPSTLTFGEETARVGGRGQRGGAGGGNTRGGRYNNKESNVGTANANSGLVDANPGGEEGGAKKRPREEDEIFLFGEDDYAMI